MGEINHHRFISPFLNTIQIYNDILSIHATYQSNDHIYDIYCSPRHMHIHKMDKLDDIHGDILDSNDTHAFYHNNPYKQPPYPHLL